ncbi:DsbA family protein [Nicoliella lavandulae]|uniref:DsbA family protein n=1 Tax=Nicoliella lavandulae TaxID=3082954 RepID=A0ABU8SM15_9LACO
MLEAYLFVDPLCKECVQAEHVILKLADDLDKTFSFQFIPMLNMKSIRDCYYKSGQHLSNESKYFKTEYNTVLDYKASLFQGRKCGRKFLMGLQDELIVNGKEYNNDVCLKVAKQAGLDIEMFEEDRRSTLAINAFKADQKLAQEMKIQKPASAVIFDCDSFECGILMDQINYNDLVEVCTNDTNIYENKDLFKYNKDGKLTPNLHVL